VQTIRSPDGIWIELLQEGQALPLEEPWKSMPNAGTWSPPKRAALPGLDRQDVAGRAVEQTFGDASEDRVGETDPAVRADHQQIRLGARRFGPQHARHLAAA